MKEMIDYSICDDGIVVKYSNKEEKRLDLTSNNILFILNQIGQKDEKSANEQLDKDYEKLIINLIIGAIVQGILCLAFCLSFINALMIPFLIAVIISCVWFGVISKIFIKDFRIMMISKRLVDLCESKDYLAEYYNKLIAKENGSLLLHVLS